MPAGAGQRVPQQIAAVQRQIFLRRELASLGDELVAEAVNGHHAHSLTIHPATTTHQRLAPEARAELGISEGFIRFSAGLEHVDDLIEDFAQALEKA